ncbi:uncharacterized protein [Panulirus ornatus]|uniref:uncharacterized protein n=1 Tax=Panulirus ornatus TaxID=150431 RepID=UPI003A850865
MTSRTRSSVIRRPHVGTSESLYRAVQGNTTTYVRRNIQQFHEIETERVTAIGLVAASTSSVRGDSGQDSQGGGQGTIETQLTKDGVVRAPEVSQAKAAESVVHLTESGDGVGGGSVCGGVGGGTTTVRLSRGVGPPPPSPPGLLGQTNISMRRQLTRPERHDVAGGGARERATRAGLSGEPAQQRQQRQHWPGSRVGGGSFSRAVASESEAAVTVTVSDTSSVDSPHLSPHRPLLHPSDRSRDAKLLKVELVDSTMDLDSGGRFERRTTILDR